MFSIDWLSAESHVLIHPLLPIATQNQLKAAVAPFSDMEGHVWLSSSGTESFPKMIALSKHAILASAEGVNTHFKIQKQHSWLNVLPLFHVGGLGIHARAFLSGSAIFDISEKKWDPINYVKMLDDNSISFSSLTPTHVYDIVNLELRAPKSLQGIIVGGGHLSHEVHQLAHALGWPLYKSYGMTETSSQIATAQSTEPNSVFISLPHIQLRFDADDFIEIKGHSLLTGYVHGNDPLRKFIDPKIEGWFKSQDKGFLQDGILKIHGRGTNFMKIGGESINFSDLESIWENIRLKYQCRHNAVLIDMPDNRLGKIVCLVIEKSKSPINFEPLISDFHSQVLPIAKIRTVYSVDALPRTELYKLKKEALRDMLSLLVSQHTQFTG